MAFVLPMDLVSWSDEKAGKQPPCESNDNLYPTCVTEVPLASSYKNKEIFKVI
jgi:hypothetical protein